MKIVTYVAGLIETENADVDMNKTDWIKKKRLSSCACMKNREENERMNQVKRKI